MNTSSDSKPDLKADVILITTCDLAAGRLDEACRLLASVRQAAANDGLNVHHYMLLQQARQDIPAELQGGERYALDLLAIPDRVSLSRARNILLARAHRDNAFADASWVAFPDDDAWYPPNLLREVSSLFANSATVDLVTCAYGSQPCSLLRGGATQAFHSASGYGELVRTLSSNTLMLRASVVQATGYFDERLGLGAPISGGEDLDYGLRAYLLHARQALISSEALVGHRDRLRWVRSRYFSGSLFALARGMRCKPALGAQVLRKLAVGAFLVTKRELAPAELWRGMCTGMGGWLRTEPEVKWMPQGQS